MASEPTDLCVQRECKHDGMENRNKQLRREECRPTKEKHIFFSIFFFTDAVRHRRLRLRLRLPFRSGTLASAGMLAIARLAYTCEGTCVRVCDNRHRQPNKGKNETAAVRRTQLIFPWNWPFKMTAYYIQNYCYYILFFFWLRWVAVIVVGCDAAHVITAILFFVCNNVL